MNDRDILKALDIGEGQDWEFKSAKGGLPGSLWATYSAMANTDGGTIALGVELRDHKHTVSGLADPVRMKIDFWNQVNNKGKISVNLLTDDAVEVKPVKGKPVLVIRVPRAGRRQRPVYVGQNPLLGTFRRNYEGDYHCTEEEVGRMLADRAEEPADSRILENFGLEDLDKRSLNQYRQRFSARDPDHAWLKEDVQGLLRKIGGWRRDRATKQEGLTVAGLLMFGKDGAIRDPDGIPKFNLDYREKLSDVPRVRWTDRITIDGTWVANLFQFYQRVVQHLTADLKIPFQLEADLYRKDETPVHEAVREALVNALIHADYSGQGGIVIEKYRDRIELSNPGTLLLSFEQLLRGGLSECRNKSLQTMFLMIGGGERAGSGMDKIRQAWKSQHWLGPRMQETVQPDRVKLVLSMVSLFPNDSLERLTKRLGGRFRKLKPLEVQALVSADVEGSVSNGRLQEICEDHPADVTKVLQRLVGQGFLEQVGQKRGAFYRLIGAPEEAGDSLHKAGDSPHKAGDSPHKAGAPPNVRVHSGESAAEEDSALVAIAQPARMNKRLAPELTEKIILSLCRGRFLNARTIAALLERNQKAIQGRFLMPMVEDGRLLLKFPAEPNRPDQAYTARGKRSNSAGRGGSNRVTRF